MDIICRQHTPNWNEVNQCNAENVNEDVVNSELNHNLNKNMIVDIILPDYILMCGLEFGGVLANRLSIMECKNQMSALQYS